MPGLLRSQAIYVLATHFEGMPLALVEAMAAGCACIASDVMQQMGLDGMVDAGFFDESMNYIDQDLSNEPELRTYFTTSTLACLTAY